MPPKNEKKTEKKVEKVEDGEKKEKKPTLSAPNVRYYGLVFDTIMYQVNDGIITTEQAYSSLERLKFFDVVEAQNQFFSDYDFKATNKQFKDFIKSVTKVSIDADKALVKAEKLANGASEKATEKEKEAEGTDEDKKKTANTAAKRARTAANTALSKAEAAKTKSEMMKD